MTNEKKYGKGIEYGTESYVMCKDSMGTTHLICERDFDNINILAQEDIFNTYEKSLALHVDNLLILKIVREEKMKRINRCFIKQIFDLIVHNEPMNKDVL